MLNAGQVAHLRSLEKGGRLTAATVVADAKNEASPLHPLFEWSIEKAAEEAWLNRARSICREVKIIVKTTTTRIEVPRLIRDPSLPSRTAGYCELGRISDPDQKRRTLAAEVSRSIGHMRRAVSVAAALGLVDDEIEATMDLWVGWLDSLEASTELLALAAD